MSVSRDAIGSYSNWRLAGNSKLEIWQSHPSSESSLIYHHRTGDTHLIDAFGCSVLGCLVISGESPCDQQFVEEHVAGELNYAVDDSFKEHVNKVLEELRKLDIIERL